MVKQSIFITMVYVYGSFTLKEATEATIYDFTGKFEESKIITLLAIVMIVYKYVLSDCHFVYIVIDEVGVV